MLRVLIKIHHFLPAKRRGGSTITHRWPKICFGREEQFFLSTPINKIRGNIYSQKTESIYDKRMLFLLYFNTVSFVKIFMGLKKAAFRFF